MRCLPITKRAWLKRPIGREPSKLDTLKAEIEKLGYTVIGMETTSVES